ncbi:hypothetical protein [Lysobacter sp. CA196]|uniref:hypothetical protein n=1 Tax=Lysobacter sp. CA196 TaxID=3455606 RepID=UPI003F8D4E4C
MFPLALSVSAAAGLLAGTPAFAAVQSDGLSHQSELSLNASVEVPVAATHALSAGAKFSVAGVEASAKGVTLTVSAVGFGTSFAVVLSAQAVKQLGLRVGQALTVSAVAGGWLLSGADGNPFCFIPNEPARTLMHSERIDA